MNLPATDILRWAIQTYGPQFAVVTSFQYEGMVLVDMALRLHPAVRVITIDTGRLPSETYDMIAKVQSRYGISVEFAKPDEAEVGAMVARHGADLFYDSVPQRTLCCQIRKVRPLAAKLLGLGIKAHAVGLRRAQTESRSAQPKVEIRGDSVKLSPLADWTAEQVEEYTRLNEVPRHPLYSKGYTSIGCGPCTRAIQGGEDERSGRWWWEQDTSKECGLHFSPSGQAERAVDVLLRDVLEAAHA